MLNLKRMAKSKDTVDKRFMTLFKIKKAKRLGVKLFDETVESVIPDFRETGTMHPTPDSGRINLLPSLSEHRSRTSFHPG